MIYKLYGMLPRSLRRFISQAFNARFLIGIIALVQDDEGRVLLFHSPYKHAWSLPEGFLKKGEDPKQAMLREIKEETGVAGEALSILDAVHTADRPMLDILISCRLDEGLKPDGKEVSDARFFNLKELPSDLVSTHRAYIAKYLIS